MFKKILVAMDGSELSKKALDSALDIAERFSAQVVILSVVEHSALQMTGFPALIPTTAYTTAMSDFSKEYIEHHRNLLSKALKHAKDSKPNLKISTKLMEGRPTNTIVKEAKDNNFDLIVMGSRGLSGITRFFLGSVSDGVVNEAECPILIVK